MKDKLFDINNFTFVISIDKEQLSHSVSTIYGHNMDTVGYLRRFFDLDYKLPKVDIKKYIDIKNILKFLKNAILKRNFNIDGLNSGEKIKKLVNEICKTKGIENINQIKMPLLIPAVNINNEKVYVFSNNILQNNCDEVKYINNVNIGTAVQASCSYPGIFSPCKYKGELLVDGGISENLPWRETKRAGADIVKRDEGVDPASVVFDAIKVAKEKNADVLICDTAGRLHNKKYLMDELIKIKRVIDKELPNASEEVLMVLDATTGQNAILQVQAFKEAVDITGIILTKLDGTAKGGAVIGIVNENKVPVKFIGVGEKIDDMEIFNSEDFVKALI